MHRLPLELLYLKRKISCGLVYSRGRLNCKGLLGCLTKDYIDGVYVSLDCPVWNGMPDLFAGIHKGGMSLFLMGLSVFSLACLTKNKASRLICIINRPVQASLGLYSKPFTVKWPERHWMSPIFPKISTIAALFTFSPQLNTTQTYSHASLEASTKCSSL